MTAKNDSALDAVRKFCQQLLRLIAPLPSRLRARA